MQRLVAEELGTTGENRVRDGFWKKVAEKHFHGRAVNHLMLSERYCQQKRRRHEAAVAAARNVTGYVAFTAEEDNFIDEAATKELEEAAGSRQVRAGFWQQMQASRFPSRTARDLSERFRKLRHDKQYGASARAGFTREEDAKIISMAQNGISNEGMGRAPRNFWVKAVASDFPHLRPQQLADRWMFHKKRLLSRKSHSCDERSSSVPFSKEEDMVITQAAQAELKASTTGRIRSGFWQKLCRQQCQEQSLIRSSRQLARRWYNLKNQKLADGNQSTNSNSEQRRIVNWKSFTDDDYQLLERLVQDELEASGNKIQVRKGFWDNVLDNHFSGRGYTAKQLCTRYSRLKNEAQSHSTDGNLLSGVEMSVSGAVSSKTTPFVALSPHQALQTKYPPGTSIIYCPSSSDSASAARPGRVMKVEMQTSTHESGNDVDSLYLFIYFRSL